jgi:hypothetical protein
MKIPITAKSTPEYEMQPEIKGNSYINCRK